MVKRRATMGAAVDAAVQETTEEWFRQHVGMRSREEAMANDIQLISATCERRPGGRLRVHIGVVTNDRRTTVSDIYDFQHSGDLGYVLKESSNPAV